MCCCGVARLRGGMATGVMYPEGEKVLHEAWFPRVVPACTVVIP